MTFTVDGAQTLSQDDNSDQEQKPNFYAIIPAYVRYCPSLSLGARLFFGEISALCSAKGFCWASNSYLANLYETEVRTIQRWLHELEENCFIKIEIDQKNKNTKRKIWIRDALSPMTKMSPMTQESPPPMTKMSGSHDKNVVHINTVNNTSKSTNVDLEGGKPPRPPKKRKGGSSKEGKEQVREWVFLLPEELKALKEKYPPELLDLMLDILDSYNSGRQESYPSDYGALKKNGWVHQKALKQSPISQASDNQNDWVKINRQYYFDLAKEAPEVMKHLRCDGKFVMNIETNKDWTLNMAPSAFKEKLFEIGGVNVEED